MLAKITVAYGLKIDKATMTTVLSSVLGTSATTLVGRAVAGSLLKAVPIGGAIVGGAISGVTGATLTYALGETYIRVVERILSGEWSQENLLGKTGRRNVSKLFKDTLKTIKKQRSRTAKGNRGKKMKQIPPPAIPSPPPVPGTDNQSELYGPQNPQSGFQSQPPNTSQGLQGHNCGSQTPGN
ncbi:MAG TPA: hypothetical protein GX717_08975, partial [Clostridiaceae bacterium]|nr:hypothetical protein [Clostridiaceae bacterium]